MTITLEDIKKAQSCIQNVAFKTSIQRSRSYSDLIGRNIFLKLENQQLTGSFKIRGALNRISNLTDDEKKQGIIASSAGNHAQGVALAAKLLGVHATIVMPRAAPLVKAHATRGYGADVVFHGDVYDEAYEHALKLQKEKGLVFVHPFNDPFVIAGQGTIALEILHEHPEIDTIVVPIGGGGLISGVAVAAKTMNPKIKIYGVQARAANSMLKSFQLKRVVQQEGRVYTIADGVAVKNANATMLNDYILKFVDEIVDVSEDEIAEGIVYLMERAKTVVEGSGALAVAALMTLKPKLGQNVAAILSGGNIDLNIVEKVIHRGLIKAGRLVELRVAAQDRPGVMKELSSILADNGCNILDVHHDRNQINMELGAASIDFTVETAGKEASDAVRAALIAKGYRLL